MLWLSESLGSKYSTLPSVTIAGVIDTSFMAGAASGIGLNSACACCNKEFSATARTGKPIVGVDLLVREAAERTQPVRLTLVCQNTVGYGNITRLVIDVVAGQGGMFSLDNGTGQRFLTRSHLLEEPGEDRR